MGGFILDGVLNSRTTWSRRDAFLDKITDFADRVNTGGTCWRYPGAMITSLFPVPRME